MGISEEQIKRINELYKKQKSEGLTKEEKSEQLKLREKYIKSIRENLRGSLENISIKNPDGSITELKHKNVYKKSN